jgi:hypothetical protein
MSERDLIKRRIEAIRGTQGGEERRRRETDASLRAQRESKDARAREMDRRAKKFAKWAGRNNIPFDYHSGRLRTGGRWVLAESSDQRRADKGGSVHSRLYVDRKGQVQQPGGGYPETKGVLLDHKARFSPEDVHIRIAQLCVEHGLEAPDL